MPKLLDRDRPAAHWLLSEFYRAIDLGLEPEYVIDQPCLPLPCSAARFLLITYSNRGYFKEPRTVYPDVSKVIDHEVVYGEAYRG